MEKNQLREDCNHIFYEYEQLIIDIIQETADNGFEYKNNT